MESELSKKIAAVRASAELGCFGAHRLPTGEWMPCSSTKQFLILTNEIKSRMSLDDVQKWSSARKAKGKKRKKRWEKLRERRILGIDTLEGGGLVSGNSRTSANAISGGSIPPMTYGNTTPPNMSTKSIKPAYMPRDNDPDVFVDIESARKRSRQLGCIGVSRRMSKGGKTVWMPCTNISDYNNLTGMTALGRLNQGKKRNTVVRTVIREELKRRKKSIPEELLGKSLGRKLRNTSRFVSARFDPNAFDGDGDGLVQEGTPFQRPAIPGVPKAPSNQPKAQDREFDNSEISAIRKWMSSMSPSEIDDFRAEPIGAYDSPENVSGLASRTGTTVAGQRRGPQRMTKPQKSVTIDGLNNPEASPTNPFRNLGGRAMGKIIRSMVKSKNDGSEQRVTYIIGGNTGSGKSTVFDGHLVPKGLVPSSEEAAVIDPDFIKKGLVGYNDGAGAGAVHRESQVVTDKVISDSASDNLNMVIMGAGARRQIQHMREARSRGESVRGHWVHVPQRVASQRIRKRTEETGRYIPDNTSHMAATLPRVISSAFEEDLLDEFYLWDNDIPEGSSPKLIAKKVRDEDFEVFDSKKFEEFAGGKKWADRWVGTANGNSRSGLASTYTGAEAYKGLENAGFTVEYGPVIKVSFPEGSEIQKFFKEKVLPFMKYKSGRTNTHQSRLGKPGIPIVGDILWILGVDVDKKKITDKRYAKNLRQLVLSSDPKVLEKLFAKAPIDGPNGESRFEELTSGRFSIETDKVTIEEIAKKIGFSEMEISKLTNEGFTLEEIAKMSEEEIKELLDAIEDEE